VDEFCEAQDRFGEVNALKAPTIDAYRRKFSQVRRLELTLPALVLREGWMLCDGDHRACALYLGAQEFHVRLESALSEAACADRLPGLA
jgi:hypothetical protein